MNGTDINLTSLKTETLKLSIEDEKKAEKAFIRYAIVAMVAYIVIKISEFKKGTQDSSIMLPIFNIEIDSTLIVDKIFHIKLFLFLLVLYAFLEWTITIIGLNRHEYYQYYSQKKSLAVQIANKWDNYISMEFFKLVNLLDLVQNLGFIIILVIIYSLIFSG
jgi:hypothetical protein